MTIYLDHNASTPIAAEVVEAMQPYLRHGYGNPSSRHWASDGLQNALAKARSQVALTINSSAGGEIWYGYTKYTTWRNNSTPFC